MLINIIGWYNEKNAGDEAFRMVFDRLFYDHDLVYSKSVLAEADRIVFGGGGVMCKSYLDSLGSRSAYAIGVDVHLNGFEYERLRAMDFKTIIVRSVEYAKIAQRQGWAEISYAPDIAFALDYPRTSFIKNRIGIILTHELSDHGEKEIIKFLQHLLDIGKTPILIAMYNGVIKPDIETMGRVGKYFNKDIDFHVNCSPIAVMGSISSCEFLLSMRFHGSVFAAAMGVPFLSLANKGKHSLFCEQEGKPDCFLNLSDMSHDKLKDAYHLQKTSGNYSRKNYDLLNKIILPQFKNRVISGI